MLEIMALDAEKFTVENVEKIPRSAVSVFVDNVDIYEVLIANVFTDKDENWNIFTAKVPTDNVFVTTVEIKAADPNKLVEEIKEAVIVFAANVFVESVEKRTLFAWSVLT
jgi:hypothetical protein